MKKILISFLILSLVPTYTAFGADFFAGENSLISKEMFDDAYLVGGNAVVDNNVFGDLYILAGNVDVNGDVMEDLVVIGGRVNVKGNVAGDIRIAGGQIAIYGNVGDDLVVGAGQVDVAKDSNVGGGVYAGSGLLTVDGDVTENIKGAFGSLILNGNVGGNVDVTVENKLNLSQNARVNGNLTYGGIMEANIPDGAVLGFTEFNEFKRKSAIADLANMYVAQKLISYFSALLILLLVVIFAPKVFVKISESTKGVIAKCFGIGLLSFILISIGSIALMATVIGVPLALIALTVLGLAIYFSKIFVAIIITGRVINLNTKKLNKFKLFFASALSLFFYYAIGMIPVLGWLVDLFLFFMGIGAMVLYKTEVVKFLHSKKFI